MEFEVRKFEYKDKSEILSMMKEFYTSDAVYTNGSDEIYQTDFEVCISESPYLEGYIFSYEGQILGYAMLAKSFSTEFGKVCIWIEDLYLKSDYRGKGLVPVFIQYLKNLYPQALFKLEVESDNSHAVHVYQKCGFKYSPYLEMTTE